MKKFYTLLAAGCVCLSAAAIPNTAEKMNNLKLHVSEVGQMVDNGEYSVVASQTRSFTANDGKVWNMTLQLTDMGWWEYLVNIDANGQEVRLEPQDLPFIIANFNVSTSDRKQAFSYRLQWPTHFFLDEWGMFLDEQSGDLIIPDDAVLDFSPVDLEQLFTGYYCPWLDENFPAVFLTPAKPGRESDSNKGYSSYFIYNTNEQGYITEVLGSVMYTPDAFGGSATATVDGNDVEYYQGSKGQSQFDVRAWETANSYIESVLNFWYLPTGATAPRNTSLFYKGTIKHKGFFPQTVDLTCSQLHIFNGGQVDQRFLRRELGYQNIEADAAYTRFYLESLGEGLDFTYFATDESELGFDSSRVAWDQGEDSAGKNVVVGALYSAPSEEAEPAIPTEPWVMLEFVGEIEKNGKKIIGMAPAVQSMLPSGYTFAPLLPIVDNSICPVDGMTGLTGSGESMYGFIWMKPETTFQVGTTDGAIFKSKQGVDTYYFNFKGDITYHYDPQDIRNVKLVPAVGTAEPVDGVQTVAADSFNVAVLGNSIVAPAGSVVYNMNGQIVNANDVAKGIYVVRCGKKAVKVLVK